MSLSELERHGFDVEPTNHAEAILSRDFHDELQALCRLLLAFRIPCAEMIQGGGNESPVTRRLRGALAAGGWVRRNMRVTRAVDGEERTSTTHEIDHVLECGRGTLVLEIEWNNKDPFFDRDLENFQRLHANGAISLGIVVTRGKSLQSDIRRILIACARAHGLRGVEDFRRLGIKALTANQQRVLEQQMHEDDFAAAVASVVASKYAESTTHWQKLRERLSRGVGSPCPLLLIGIPASRVTVPAGEDPNRRT